MRLSLGLGVFLAVVCGAFLTRFYSVTHFSDRAGYRNPAAISPHLLDLSQDQVFDSASKKRVLSGTKAWKEDGAVAIQVGHFIAKGVNGESSQLCEIFHDLSLTFSAEGMAVSGARPTMIIEGACVASKDGSTTEAIWIPVDQIKGEKPADAELRFTTPSNIVVKLRDIPGEWPTYWVLKEIKLLDKKEGRSMTIDTPTIYKLSQVPISFSWN